ncbi:MAG: helix-turn-helix domain-containing protein [Chloroflexi bacterium]|nr:helix-turn-helix domain-containing protein [Chloroflexota bacterium]
MEKAAFSIREATVYLGINRATLYRLMNSGALESFHVGRRRLLARSALDRFIQQQTDSEPLRG